MILSVDPSSLSAGVALFTPKRGILRAAFCIAPSPAGPQNVARKIAEAVKEYDIHELAIEEPMQFRSKRGRKVKVDNLLLLARAVGATVARIDVQTYYYTPSKWKGSLPKRVTKRRIKDLLTEKEHATIDLPRDKKQQGDIYDAIGIGLFHIGRARKGIAPK